MRRRVPWHDARSVLLYSAMPALSVLNALVGLVLPGLFGPTGFGEYSLAATLFQYGLIFDLGLSQVIDRRVPLLAGAERRAFVERVLWGRLLIAAVVMLCGSIVLVVLAWRSVLPFGLAAGLLSLAAGLASMLSLGPMAVDRASSQRRAFALAAVAGGLVLAAGRPLGILLAGIPGSFIALLAGYGCIAVVVAGRHPVHRPAPPMRDTADLVRNGLPLFATSLIWAVYMTANRWVVSFLADPVELGHFAFAANIVALIVGAVGALSQLYYPAMVNRAAAGGHFSISGHVSRDLSAISLLLTVAAGTGILLGPWAIHLFYPGFAGTEEAVRILLISIPGLVVSSWLMPLSLSTAARPWIEGLVTYPAALLLLIAGTWAGFRLGGITGAGWGLVVSAPLLLTLQLGALRMGRLLSGRGALQLLLVSAAGTALLAFLAIRITP